MVSQNILAPGTVVGKYEILRPLGTGGMARIYLARVEGPGQFEKLCALKIMQPDYADGAVSDLLLHEASVAARLHHPNIVQVFDLGTHSDHYYMAMEWVDGASLARVLNYVARSGRLLPIEQVVHVASRVAEALEYLREGVLLDGVKSSLVHRDVSPSNVLVSREGTVKLTDFGIVKVLEAPSSTRVGVVKGKYAYMAPEQLRGDPVDHRSDIFGLGVVLFEALTCRRLFHRKTLAATVAAVHAARVLPPSALNEDVPHELDKVVLKALAKRPEDRYSTAQQMLVDLEPFRVSAARHDLGLEVSRLMVVGEQEGPADPRRSSGFLPPVHTPPPQVPEATAVEELPDIRIEEFAALERDMHEDEDESSSYAEESPEPIYVQRTPFPAAGSSEDLHAEMMMSTPRAANARLAPLAIVLLTAIGTIVFWWTVLGTAR